MISFAAGGLAKIKKIIKQIQPDKTLIAFKDLSTIINRAFNRLPAKVIPILQRLYVSYSRTKTAIEVAFNSSSDILSQFIIKSSQVIRHGMNKNDQKALMKLGNQLKTFFINELDTFVESSRDELVQIQSQLLLEATGGRAQYLLDRRNELEPEFLHLSALLRNKSLECINNQEIIDILDLEGLIKSINPAFGTNQTIPDSGRWAKNFTTGFTTDYAAIRNEMKLEVAKLREQMHQHKYEVGKYRRPVHSVDMARTYGQNLKHLMQRQDPPDETNKIHEYDTKQGISNILEHRKIIMANFNGSLEATKAEMMAMRATLNEQIQEYKNKIQEYRDRQSEQRGSFWIFSWKVRDVYARDMEKLVQENVTRLRERTNFLQNVFQNDSFGHFVEGILAGRKALPFYKAKQIQLAKEYKNLKLRLDQVSHRFDAIIQEIDAIYRSTGTIHVESMRMVDELCRAVQNGHESITAAFAMLRIYLSAISIDLDLLVASVLDAVRVLNMVDSYLNTTKIEKIKQSSAFQ